MFKQMMMLAAVVAASTMGYGTAAQTLTGFLNPHGKLVKLAVGDEPKRPCRRRQVQVTLNGDGPPAIIQFVGFSAVEVNPNNDDPGFPGMHAACQAVVAFGPEARLCTGEEFALSWRRMRVQVRLKAGAWLCPPSVSHR